MIRIADTWVEDGKGGHRPKAGRTSGAIDTWVEDGKDGVRVRRVGGSRVAEKWT